MGHGLNLQTAEPREGPSSNSSGGTELLPDLLFDMEEVPMAAQAAGHTLTSHNRYCPISRTSISADGGLVNSGHLSKIHRPS